MLSLLRCLKVRGSGANFLAALLGCKEDLTRAVSQLRSLLSEAVIFKQFLPCKLSLLRRCIVDEGMGPELSVLLGLLHPDGTDLTVLGEDLLD